MECKKHSEEALFPQDHWPDYSTSFTHENRPIPIDHGEIIYGDPISVFAHQDSGAALNLQSGELCWLTVEAFE